LSEKTVKNYVSDILSKLHVRDRTEAAVYALRMSLVTDGDRQRTSNHQKVPRPRGTPRGGLAITS
jgi:hypothetical protein